MLLILSLFKRLKGLFGLIPAAWPEKNPTQRPLRCFHRWVPPELRKTYFYHGLLGDRPSGALKWSQLALKTPSVAENTKLVLPVGPAGGAQS